MKCQIAGRPAERAVQRTDSFSQSTLPKRRVGASGRVESEDRMGTDSYISALAPLALWSKPVLELCRRAYIPLHVHWATASKAALVPTCKVDHPFFLAFKFGRKLALEVADIHALDFLCSNLRGSSIDWVGNTTREVVDPLFDIIEDVLEGVLGERERWEKRE